MKRITLVVLAVFSLAGAGLGSSLAAAGDGAKTTHFTASYTDAVFGLVVCAGERISKSALKAFIKDSEDCTLLEGFPARDLRLRGQTFEGWASDYDGMLALDCTFVITDNGDGTWNNHIVAYY